MSCYSDCNNIKWYKIQQRAACRKDCDAAAYQLQVDETQETLAAQNEATSTLFKWLFPTAIILIVLVIIAKWKRWI